MFGKLIGVIEPENYAARGGDIFLALVKRCAPKDQIEDMFVRAGAFDRGEGGVHQSFIPTSMAMAAVDLVFPAKALDFSIDEMELECELRQALTQKVRWFFLLGRRAAYSLFAECELCSDAN